MIQEEIDKDKAKQERPKGINELVSDTLKESPTVEIGGALPIDSNLAKTEGQVDEMIDNEIAPEDLPGTYAKSIEAAAEAGALNAEAAKKITDLGAKAATEVQQAFSGKRIAELGSIVDKFVGQAKNAGVDEKQARAALKEQLGLYHDTYKEAGLDAQAAEIDSFARSLENAGEVSSDQGKQLAEMIDSGTFASMEDFNTALDKRMKGAGNKIPGTEVNVLIARATEKFKAEVDAMKAAQAEEAKKGIGATDDDIDDMLGGFGEEQRKAS